MMAMIGDIKELPFFKEGDVVLVECPGVEPFEACLDFQVDSHQWVTRDWAVVDDRICTLLDKDE